MRLSIRGETTLWTLPVVVVGWWLVFLSTQPVLRMSPGVLALVALAEVVPIWLLRSHPAWAWYSAALLAVLLPMSFTVLDDDPWSWPPTLGITLLVALANLCSRGGVLPVAGAWVSAPVVFWTHSRPDTQAGWMTAIGAIIVVFGALRAVRGARREVGRERKLTEAERRRAAVLEERARIARDLHDVVAHHMSMVVVQAETAPYRLHGLSSEASADFAAIGQTAREALNEVRGLLGVLRSEQISADLRPQPGLEQLDELVATAIRAGAEVAVEICGEARPVRPGVDVGAYRIVQESLANAARHAPGAPVRVEVGYGPDAVSLAVVNAAPRTAIPPEPSSREPSSPESSSAGPSFAGPSSAGQGSPGQGSPGHGLTGMAERAAVVGGELTAGPTTDGGFAVRARLPVALEATP